MLSAYTFSIHVKADDGNTLTGTSRISLGSEFGVMAFTATKQGKVIDHTETKILRQRIYVAQWCLKSATLQISESHKILQGPWQADHCVAGDINVTRTARR
jgi:hypothetical protein